MPQNTPATIEIQNMNGQVVETILPENNNGKVEFTFDGSGLLPGIYFCELRSEERVAVRKMVKVN